MIEALPVNSPGADLEIKIVLPIPFRGSVLSASFRAFTVGGLSASSGMDRVARLKRISANFLPKYSSAINCSCAFKCVKSSTQRPSL
jgi:hypothetical protein